jgi:uncharacterized membrane protein
MTDAEIEIEAKAADRVVFFSDAVIAIAITLLALGLPLPNEVRHFTNLQLLDALRAEKWSYIDFLISFAVIGNHWTTHRRIFRYVCMTNGIVRRLNMLWLLTMIMTPFATELLSGNGARGVRFTVYALVQIIASLCLLGMRQQTVSHGMLLPSTPERARHPNLSPYLAFVIVFTVSIPVAFFSAWAYAVWAAAPVMERLLARFGGGPSSGHRPLGHRGGRAGPAHRG